KLTINYKDKISSMIESAFFHFKGFEEEEENDEEQDEEEEVIADYFYAELSDLCDPLYLATDTSNTEVYITINQSVSNFLLKQEHLSANLYDGNDKIATLKIEEIIKDSSRDYKFILEEIPYIDIERDDYKIILYLNYPGHNEISLNIPVEIASEFGGTVKKKDGVVVSTTLEIRKTGFYRKLKTNTKGEFSTILPFGTYDIKFVFEDNTESPVVMKIEGALFEKTETSVKFAKNSITYDNINSAETDIDLNGMRVANMIVFQFALPFDNAEIQTYYDASKIYNEENIAVFRCSNWNNGAQNCISGFKEISDITKNINSDFVIIQSTGLGSFIISSIDSLKVELNKLNKNYLSQEDMVFEGIVLDLESKVLDKATVHYYIKNTNIAGKTETNEDGSFEAIFEAPKKSGIYRLYYYADKSPFFPSNNESTTFEVLQKPDMEVTLPSSDSLKIIPDQKTNLDFIIKNNGDMTLNDIRIDIECDGLREKEDYNYYPKTLDKLSTGSEEKITFFIELKNELCELYGCKTVYSCGLTIESKEKTVSQSLMLPLNVDSKDDTPEENTIQITEAQLQSNDAISSEDEKDQKPSSFIPKISITGFASKITSPFADNTNSMNLKIIAVFMLIILSIVVFRNKNSNTSQASYKYTKKFRPSGGVPRKNIINSFNKIKKEINGGS
ncbi:MAG: hypothetical protein KAQ92_03885, partial [Candidatus Aenigmarchaeota archaeon]|nr:hypothetical protein [Candidatus Aenigmarchaeota archaeon]